jgi:hypothetical protein
MRGGGAGLISLTIDKGMRGVDPWPWISLHKRSINRLATSKGLVDGMRYAGGGQQHRTLTYRVWP